jgi:putative transposase
MPRKLREEAAGAVHHVYARAVSGQDLFADDRDRRDYLSMLGVEVTRHRWLCLAYCLMSNHLHLLVETPQPNLGIGMQRLHGDYARVFNGRHRRAGHLFQGRYGSKLVTSDAQLWTVTRYIARNPVDAGLCAAPDRWHWGSHRATVAGDAPAWLATRRLLELFSGAGGDPRESYRDLVTGTPDGASAP